MMKALILAGGAGTRLRSIVNDRPKPMASIKDKPFLEHQIEFLRSHGLRHFVLCVGYRHADIQSYFEDGARWDVSIQYSLEESPLGTGGALKNAQRFVDGTFVLLNGDSFFNVDVQELRRFHAEKRILHPRTLGTIALTHVADTSSYGSVSLDEDDRIVGFQEKSERVQSSQISAGIYVLEHQILDLLADSQPVSLERETLPAILQSDHQLFGYSSAGFFVDIGTPEGYYTFRNFIEGKQQ